MTYLNSIHSFKDRRKFLRNNATFYERKLWEKLKEQQLGYKFRRQHGIGFYIVDFCCVRQKLIVEIDGEYHSDTEARKNDEARTLYFIGLGFREIRFTNDEVEFEIEEVLAKIRNNLL